MNQNSVDLVLIGDSLTFGYGVPKKDSWVYKLQEKYPYKNILNKGINGDTTSSMLTRYYKDVLIKKPKNIFIMGGTNDLLSGRNVDYIVKNIEIMIKEGLENNSNIIVGIPPIIIKDLAETLFMPSNYYKNCDENLSSLRESIINLQKKYPFKYIDFYTLTKNHVLSEKIFLDGIHLNIKGNTLLLNCFLDVF